MAPKREKKTADMQKYRAEYSAEKSADIIERTSNNYYKKKYGMTDEDLEAYGDLSLDAGKAIHLLRIIKANKPELLPSILSKV